MINGFLLVLHMTIATNFAVSFVEIVCSISLSELLQVVPHFSVLKLSILGSAFAVLFNVVFYNQSMLIGIYRSASLGFLSP